MIRIERSALIEYSPLQMFQLVQDVNSYPEFLSWCYKTELQQDLADEQLATLFVRFAGLEQKFTTRNRLQRPEQVSMSLVSGPFHNLAGDWRFQALGDDGSKVILDLRFDFAHSMLSKAFERGFAHVADRLVKDFCYRADQVYG